MFVGCLWMALGMYGFLALNLYQWAQKHKHSMFRECCHMFTHPIRWREFGPPQKCGYEPVHTQTSKESSELSDEVLDFRVVETANKVQWSIPHHSQVKDANV